MFLGPPYPAAGSTTDARNMTERRPGSSMSNWIGYSKIEKGQFVDLEKLLSKIQKLDVIRMIQGLN